jgi:hypothetical protein
LCLTAVKQKLMIKERLDVVKKSGYPAVTGYKGTKLKLDKNPGNLFSCQSAIPSDEPMIMMVENYYCSPKKLS